MDEIEPEELYDRLIEHGLFSEKFPPIFDASSFLKFCKTSKYKKIEPNKKTFSYISYNTIRNVHIPRLISIPNPVAYEILCRYLRDSWDKLKEHFYKTTCNQKHIVSRIHIRKYNDTDSLFKMNYDNWKDEGSPESDIIIGKQFLVSTDISQFFPSIYTHSISWALIGKEKAKQSKGKSNNCKCADAYNDEFWYDCIDRHTRNLKNGETHGILIGPHASNIISEIILCKVDEELCKKWDYVRNIDDYQCFVNTYDDANKFLFDLNECLKKYNLSLNHKKTQIKELPTVIDTSWIDSIQNHISIFEKSDSYIDYKEIKRFINLILDLMSKNEDNAAILSYSMKVLREKKLSQNARDYYLKMSISFALIYPYIVPILDKCLFTPFNIETSLIENYLNLIYEKYFSKNYYEACSFVLQYATKYSVKIHNFNVDKIIEKEDCILDLIALIYCRKHNLINNICTLKEYAINLKTNKNFDNFWPFLYECLRREELPDYWKILKKNNVSFLKLEYR